MPNLTNSEILKVSLLAFSSIFFFLIPRSSSGRVDTDGVEVKVLHVEPSENPGVDVDDRFEMV